MKKSKNLTINVTKETHDEILKNNKVVLFDFWAPWCGPCRDMGPVMEQLSDQYQGKVVVGKVNIDEESELVDQYTIRTIPHFVFFKDGVAVDVLQGRQDKSKFVEKLKKLLE